MALINKYVASVTYRDGVQRDSVVSVYVSEADAEAWITAADETARTATDVGTLFEKMDALVAGTLIRRSVSLEQLVDLPANPADDILRGNKLAVEFIADGRNYVMTIPCRNPASFTQKDDSLEVELGTGAAVPAFITAFQNVAVTRAGDSVTVRRIRVAD